MRIGMLLAVLLLVHTTALEASGSTVIYRCEQADGVVFADRPCASKASAYTPGAPINQYTPAAMPSRATAQKPVRKKAAVSDATASKDAQCQRWESALRDIRSQMRAGYSLQQGERLRARKTRLDQQVRAARC